MPDSTGARRRARPPAPGALPRLGAARASLRVLDQGQALGQAWLPEIVQLDASRDRAQLRRLARALMRSWPDIDGWIGQLVERRLKGRDRLAHFLLAVAMAELIEAREPAPAVIHASVEATRLGRMKHLAGLVNAVLRQFVRQYRPPAETDLVKRYGYPGWLIERLQDDWPEHWRQILEAGNQVPPLWLRVNRRRWSIDQAQAELTAAGLAPRPSPHAPDALALDRQVKVSTLPGIDSGALSVQDAAAQLAVEYLDLAPGQRILDACAAPGGKSGHVLERADCELVAVDSDPERAAMIGANLDRLGLAGEVICADAGDPEQWWDGRPFDRILVDAPCSATGVIRRHPDIRWLRRPSDVEANSATQARLLASVWPLLRPGGILVYATCSILAVENADQGRRFVEQCPDARVLDQASRPGRPVRPGRQILPGDDDMDGFYYLAVQRLPADR